MGAERSQTPRLATGIGEARQSVFAALQGRIEAYRKGGGELIPLHIGDTHLAPPAGALAPIEGHRALSLYGAIPGVPALREALAARLMARGLASVKGAANVHVGCGCTHALYCAARALLDPGDEVLVVSPYWPLIPGVLETCGAKPVEVPLTDRLRDANLDIAAELERHRSARTRALYFITPNNPDGSVYSVAQLETLADYARAHDLWVLSDEVYADYVYQGEHRSIANLPGMVARTVTSHSMSKSHALAGARIGYVAASERVIDATRRVSNHTVYNVPVAMQQAALGALEHGEAWLVDAKQTYLQARDAMASALDRAGVEHVVPAGGSFFFLDLRARLAGREPNELFERVIDAGVLVAPGRAFGAGYDAFARLCFTGAPVADLVEGVERFGRVLEGMG
jgi:aspartate/methionine/tyrosine aminotransferase